MALGGHRGDGGHQPGPRRLPADGVGEALPGPGRAGAVRVGLHLPLPGGADLPGGDRRQGQPDDPGCLDGPHRLRLPGVPALAPSPPQPLAARHRAFPRGAAGRCWITVIGCLR